MILFLLGCVCMKEQMHRAEFWKAVILARLCDLCMICSVSLWTSDAGERMCCWRGCGDKRMKEWQGSQGTV